MDYQEALEMFERDVVNFAKQGYWGMADRYQCVIDAIKELKQYKALNMTPKQIQEMQINYCATKMFLDEYRKLGTMEEIKNVIEERNVSNNI